MSVELVYLNSTGFICDPKTERPQWQNKRTKDKWDKLQTAPAVDLPFAIEPTNIHPRMNAQHSYFTVHGKNPAPLHTLVGGECLRKLIIQLDRDEVLNDLRLLGIDRSTVLPDADALAKELANTLLVPD